MSIIFEEAAATTDPESLLPIMLRENLYHELHETLHQLFGSNSTQGVSEALPLMYNHRGEVITDPHNYVYMQLREVDRHVAEVHRHELSRLLAFVFDSSVNVTLDEQPFFRGAPVRSHKTYTKISLNELRMENGHYAQYKDRKKHPLLSKVISSEKRHTEAIFNHSASSKFNNKNYTKRQPRQKCLRTPANK